MHLCVRNPWQLSPLCVTVIIYNNLISQGFNQSSYNSHTARYDSRLHWKTWHYQMHKKPLAFPSSLTPVHWHQCIKSGWKPCRKTTAGEMHCQLSSWSLSWRPASLAWPLQIVEPGWCDAPWVLLREYLGLLLFLLQLATIIWPFNTMEILLSTLTRNSSHMRSSVKIWPASCYLRLHYVADVSINLTSPV